MTKVDVPLHVPIMVTEILNFASPNLSKKEARYFDATFGRGGHFKALVNQFPHIEVVAVDRDQEALDYAKKEFSSYLESGQLKIYHENHSQFDHEKWGLFDFMLLDLGVSSPQLDEAKRGFSFYHDGPLDMRMDLSEEYTAAEAINQLSEKELISLFQKLGEVRSPFRVVRAIVHDRQNKPFESTRALASLIERVDGWKKKGIHPATQYFLGLRLFVNSELESTEIGLKKLITGLKPQGRLAVLTFHSLEDRIVKRMFKEGARDWGGPLFKKVIEASEEELKINPRARSCKLRVFERNLQDAEKKVQNSSN